MTIFQAIILFVAIVSTVICVTGFITSWVGIIALKDNYYDKFWFNRTLCLFVSAASITTLLYWLIN